MTLKIARKGAKFAEAEIEFWKRILEPILVFINYYELIPTSFLKDTLTQFLFLLYFLKNYTRRPCYAYNFFVA